MRWPHNDFIAGHILLRKVAHSEESELSGERLLTPRELHVLNLIEKGLSNKEIARALCVEIATVKNPCIRFFPRREPGGVVKPSTCAPQMN
jgi:DNA-binding NarL/FixJ family response regulator